MKKILVCDTSAKLSQALVEQYNIMVINPSKSPLGQITYILDCLVTSGFDVVYMTNKDVFPVISSTCLKIVNMHSSGSIELVNIDNATIGKNNLVLRLASNDTDQVLIDYKCEHQLFNQETKLNFNSVSFSHKRF